MDMVQRFRDDRQHQTTAFSARSRISDPCRQLPCPPPRHHPISPTFPSAQRQLITPALICLQPHHQWHRTGCTHLIPRTPAFGTPQPSRNTRQRPLHTRWRPRYLSEQATQRIACLHIVWKHRSHSRTWTRACRSRRRTSSLWCRMCRHEPRPRA